MTNLELAINEHLASQRSTLWGRAWDVLDEDGRAAAGAWLFTQIAEVRAIEQRLASTRRAALDALYGDFPG